MIKIFNRPAALVNWGYCAEYITISPFLIFYVYQGSVATWVGCGGKDDNSFIANSLLNPKVKIDQHLAQL